MSTLANIYLKKDVLETLLKTVNAKNEKGVSITLSISDEINQYGQNISGFVTQTKEQREQKKQKFYVGNGEVVWTDGNIVKGGKVQQPTEAQPQQTQIQDDLPF